ncbi:MAG: FkbM family methyltransferase [Rhodospirillales bacterium]|nr:FkbM family methyltransferase [Rhodospirillales bacterium]
MSKTTSSLIVGLAKLLTFPMKPYRRRDTLGLASEGLVQNYSMAVPTGDILFESRTARSMHDANSITHGEPETIRWIDGLQEGSTLWDIGANVGVYSLYAAYVRRLAVMAFEPGAANHAALCRNIEINRLDELIQPLCLAFTNQTSIDHLYLANTGAGHSMHGFGQPLSAHGKIDYQYRQSVTGYSIDEFCKIFIPKFPDYVKLDVDGIELNIIEGGENTLRDHVKSIIVEIEEDNLASKGDDIYRLLKGLGFHERRSENLSLRNVIFDK